MCFSKPVTGRTLKRTTASLQWYKLHLNGKTSKPVSHLIGSKGRNQAPFKVWVNWIQLVQPRLVGVDVLAILLGCEVPRAVCGTS
jgi:hypothetical protein